MLRRIVSALVALVPALGRADGIAIVGGSPRAIGRAGAATVGDDGGGALLVNPAAMARRDTIRAELGAAMIDDTVQWQTETPFAPLSVGRAGSQLAPLGAVIVGVGDWSFGAGAMTAAVIDRSLPRPSDARGDLMAAYDYRYAGIAGSYRRDTLSLGAARRLGDSLALGVALAASRIAVTEHRRMWAGLDGRVVGSPSEDVDLSLSASEALSPSAVAGVLYAPVDSQIELGASVGWARTARLDGTASGAGTATGPNVVGTNAHASLEVRQPITERAGGRYVGDRVVAELDGDLWVATAGSGSTAWSIQGLSVVDPMQRARDRDLERVPSRIAQHTHVALRTAVDVAVIPGFLWVTGGYAFSTRATPASRLSPSFGDLGGHTLGLGLDTTAGGVTVTLGWSRTWAIRTAAPSELRVDNPFYGADGPVPPGTYDGSIDQVGLLIEAELGQH